MTTMTTQTKEDTAPSFLRTPLSRCFTKEHFQKNQGITISDEAWARFIDECGDIFVSNALELIEEIWDANKGEYEYTEN